MQRKDAGSESEVEVGAMPGDGGVDAVDHVPFVILYDDAPIGYS
jgi:hypothetical protein